MDRNYPSQQPGHSHSLQLADTAKTANMAAELNFPGEKKSEGVFVSIVQSAMTITAHPGPAVGGV